MRMRIIRRLDWYVLRSYLLLFAGTFFVCSCKGSSFGSLNEDEQRRYLDRYKWPEAFFNVNGKVYAMPVKPQDRGEAR